MPWVGRIKGGDLHTGDRGSPVLLPGAINNSVVVYSGTFVVATSALIWLQEEMITLFDRVVITPAQTVMSV